MGTNLKIKSLESLGDYLDEDLAWRKKEMLSLKLLVEKDQVNREILLRAGIALLCAHFEGFVKYSSDCYVAYVSNQKIKSSALKNNFLALKMEKAFAACATSPKHSVHTNIIDKYLHYIESNFQLNITKEKGVISTHSNPSSKELKEILATLGIESNLFETKAHYIDDSLLKNRHCVVHGERSNLEMEDFLTTFRIIMKLIEEYQQLIIQSAEDEDYLKGDSSCGIDVSGTNAN
jgi:hypothetical protein